MKKIFILAILFLNINTINAKSIIEEEIREKGYYTNAQNVTIDTENYNKIKGVMTEEEIDEINANYYKNLKKGGTVLQRKTIYYETYTYTGKTGEVFTTTKEISKDEYKKNSNSLERGLKDEHSTTYKKVTLEEKAKTASQIIVDLTVEWTKMPQHRSYDILAIRTSSNQIMYNYSGFQDYKKNGVESTINYAYGNANFKEFSNGIGLSQNLVDNATFYYQNIQLTTNCNATMKIYATYQHAQGTVTLAQSQNYTLSYNGLGKVVLFNSNDISNIYDGMSGVEISPICMN